MRRASDPLTGICLEDLLDSLGAAARGRALLRPVFRPAAQRFARTVRAFDDLVGVHGLAAGSQWLVQRMAGGMRVAGFSRVPSHGPLLVLANHPGMIDTVALFASLAARPDLRVIAQDRPFLRALPNVASRVLFVAGDGASRSRVLRDGVKHLRQGGALLSFPAGRIEPDPVAAGAGPALESLQGWSASFALFARAVPQTHIVTAIVSQVVSAAASRHPLTRLRHAPADRDRLAATLQILWRPYRALPACVAFGTPYGVPGNGADGLRRAIIAQARMLMATPMLADGHA
ncbi:MAG: 1-acyl-sn-glycerol-3-phosphate acyltransferase [Burkholderiaceae bacterium]